MANYNIRPGPGRLPGIDALNADWIHNAKPAEIKDVRTIQAELKRLGRLAPRHLVDKLSMIRNRCVKRAGENSSKSPGIEIADEGGWEVLGVDGHKRWFDSYHEAHRAFVRLRSACVSIRRDHG